LPEALLEKCSVWFRNAKVIAALKSDSDFKNFPEKIRTDITTELDACLRRIAGGSESGFEKRVLPETPPPKSDIPRGVVLPSRKRIIAIDEANGSTRKSVPTLGSKRRKTKPSDESHLSGGPSTAVLGQSRRQGIIAKFDHVVEVAHYYNLQITKSTNETVFLLQQTSESKWERKFSTFSMKRYDSNKLVENQPESDSDYILITHDLLELFK